jgi:ABC-2 type transport system ATP-binding protein
VPAQEPLEVIARIETARQAVAVLTALTEGGVDVSQFSVGDPSLDEVFLALTGRPPQDAAKEVKP